VTGPIPLSWLDLAGASALVILNGLVSTWLGLGLGRRLLVASVRTVVQLSLLGLILRPVFELGQPWLVGCIGLVMVVLAGREGVRRAVPAGQRVSGMQAAAFVSLLVGGGVPTLFATAVLLQVDPWWEPRYLVPLLGMVLGNALTGVSLGLDRCLTSLEQGRDRVEALLALGATRWEAARPVVADAVRTGMIPILNAMSVVGLVTIPGMMTGQILGGSSPELAARYQVLVMFLIAAAVAMGTTGAVVLVVRSRFDDQHRLRWHGPQQ
jgi:putative ABC transport system permease protein